MWVIRVQPWVDGWDQAEENVALLTPAHTEASYMAYLSWYEPKTPTVRLKPRPRFLVVPHSSSLPQHLIGLSSIIQVREDTY